MARIAQMVVSGPGHHVAQGVSVGAGPRESKNLRLQKVVYPAGREVYCAYPASGTIGATMNRVGAIGSGDANGRYEFLGAGAAVVKLDYPRVSGGQGAAAGLGLSYDPNANGLYEVLDRFGSTDLAAGRPRDRPRLAWAQA